METCNLTQWVCSKANWSQWKDCVDITEIWIWPIWHHENTMNILHFSFTYMLWFPSVVLKWLELCNLFCINQNKPRVQNSLLNLFMLILIYIKSKKGLLSNITGFQIKRRQQENTKQPSHKTWSSMTAHSNRCAWQCSPKINELLKLAFKHHYELC